MSILPGTCIFLSLFIPAFILGIVFWGWVGAIVAFALVSITYVSFFAFSETIISFFYQGTVTEQCFVLKDMIQQAGDLPGATWTKSELNPNVLVFPFPLPGVVVVKSLLGQGTILFSQGLTASIAAEQLEKLIYLCLERLRNPKIKLASGIGVLITLFMVLFPREVSSFLISDTKSYRSKKLDHLNVFSAIRALLLIPFIQLYLFFGKTVAWKISEPNIIGSLHQVFNRGAVSSLKLDLPWGNNFLSLQIILPEV